MRNFANKSMSVVRLVPFVFYLASIEAGHCSDGFKRLGYTVPSGDVNLEHGKELEITCNLREDVVKACGNDTAERMSIVLDNIVQPTRIINSTSIKLNIAMPEKRYEAYYVCKLDSYYISMNIVSIGTSPQNVSHFKCINYNFDNVTCNWTAPDNFIATEYKFEHCQSQRRCQSRYVEKKPNEDSFSVSVDVTDVRIIKITLHMTNCLGVNVNSFEFDPLSRVISNPPEALKLIETTPNSIKVTWKLPNRMTLYPFGFIHRITQRKRTHSFESRSATLEYNLVGLNAYTNYDISVSIRPIEPNRNYQSSWSSNSSIVAKTKATLPAKPPQTVAGCFQIIGDNNVYLYWKSVDETEENGPNFRYYVELVEDGALKQSRLSQNSAEFEGLRTGGHKFRIWSANDVGQSEDYSEIVTFPKASTPVIIDFHNVDYSNGTFKLIWTSVDNQPIDNYTIFWYTNYKIIASTSLEWTTLSSNASKYNLHLVDYRNDTRYRFAIAANARNSSTGMIWSSCTVLPERASAKLKNVIVASVLSSSVVVKWQLECSNKFYEITGFVVNYCRANDSTSCREDYTKRNVHLISDLLPYTTYKVRVKIETTNGAYSDALLVKTAEGRPSVPLALRYRNVNDSSVLITWQKPSKPNGRIRYYQLSYGDINLNVTPHSDGQHLNYTLTGLTSYSNYRIKLVACTVACSELVTLDVTTMMAAPGVVDQREQTWNGSVMTIKWITRGKVDYYQVRFSLNRNETIVKEVTDTAFSIDCKRNEIFFVSVRAVNVIDDVPRPGPWSKSVEHRCILPTSVVWVYLTFCLATFVGFCLCFVRKWHKVVRDMTNVDWLYKVAVNFDNKFLNEPAHDHVSVALGQTDDLCPVEDVDISRQSENIVNQPSSDLEKKNWVNVDPKFGNIGSQFIGGSLNSLNSNSFECLTEMLDSLAADQVQVKDLAKSFTCEC